MIYHYKLSLDNCESTMKLIEKWWYAQYILRYETLFCDSIPAMTLQCPFDRKTLFFPNH